MALHLTNLTRLLWPKKQLMRINNYGLNIFFTTFKAYKTNLTRIKKIKKNGIYLFSAIVIIILGRCSK